MHFSQNPQQKSWQIFPKLLKKSKNLKQVKQKTQRYFALDFLCLCFIMPQNAKLFWKFEKTLSGHIPKLSIRKMHRKPTCRKTHRTTPPPQRPQPRQQNVENFVEKWKTSKIPNTQNQNVEKFSTKPSLYTKMWKTTVFMWKECGKVIQNCGKLIQNCGKPINFCGKTVKNCGKVGLRARILIRMYPKWTRQKPPFGGYNLDIDFLRYGASSLASLFIDTPSPMSAPAVRFIV